MQTLNDTTIKENVKTVRPVKKKWKTNKVFYSDKPGHISKYCKTKISNNKKHFDNVTKLIIKCHRKPGIDNEFGDNNRSKFDYDTKLNSPDVRMFKMQRHQVMTVCEVNTA